MEKTIVKIGDKEFDFKLDLRAFMVYESMAGKPFKGGLTLDFLGLMYAGLVIHNRNFDMTFDHFVDCIEENPLLFNKMVEYIKNYFSMKYADTDSTERT